MQLGPGAIYLIDPVSFTESSLTQLITASGTLGLSLETVCVRAVIENRTRLMEELDTARQALPELEKALESMKARTHKREKGVKDAVNPDVRRKQENLLENLLDKIDDCEAKIAANRRIVEKHLARLDFIAKKYPPGGRPLDDMMEELDPPRDQVPAGSCTSYTEVHQQG